MSNKVERDEFTPKTKNALAARANFRCSYPDCTAITCGPSSESPLAVTNVGVAAHICAAAPGGRRYDKNMSSEERSDIDNGIWLCQTHATLIDRDEKTFTAEVLTKMKQKHEETVQSQLYNLPTSDMSNDLFMIGDDFIFLGSFKEFNVDSWTVEVKEYLRGSKFELLDFISDFSELSYDEKIIICESFSDGRELVNAPAISFEDGRLLLRCVVSKRTERISIDKIGLDIALDETGDLGIFNGSLKMIGGLDRLPQLLFMYLSTVKGEIETHPKFGVRLGEYYHFYKDTIWLDKIFKLEIIKAASIIIDDEGRTTPLKCIQKVYDVRILGDVNEKNKVSIYVSLEVKGHGQWEKELQIFIPPNH
ncbi:hypothetical protein SAMN03159294_1527 [Kosakonia radicincitans]|nr:hypothetical protein SAMN03159294_1527 [Kosakonia radicincitans]